MIVKTALISILVFFLASLNSETIAAFDSEIDYYYYPKSDVELNVGVNNGINTSSKNSCTNRTIVLSCLQNRTEIDSTVEIVNVTRLTKILAHEPNVTHRRVPGTCVVVFFYSPSCPFSSLAAPHYNALPRYYPDLKMIAFDVQKNRKVHAKYGVMGTPTLMLFHGGRPVVWFNDTGHYVLDGFTKFITKYTGMYPEGIPALTPKDYTGPLQVVPSNEVDYYFILSCLLIAARILYSLYYTSWGRSFVDATLNAWREAEAQHHHAE